MCLQSLVCSLWDHTCGRCLCLLLIQVDNKRSLVSVKFLVIMLGLMLCLRASVARRSKHSSTYHKHRANLDQTCSFGVACMCRLCNNHIAQRHRYIEGRVSKFVLFDLRCFWVAMLRVARVQHILTRLYVASPLSFSSAPSSSIVVVVVIAVSIFVTIVSSSGRA